MANATTTTRRALLKAAPALALAGALPAMASPTEGPIAALFREWEGVRDAYNTHPGADDDEAAFEIIDRLNRIEDTILQAPPQSARDMACKLVIIDTYGGLEGDHAEDLLAEARALIGA